MRYLPQRLKLTFFKIISPRAAIKGPAEKNTKFQKTLTLAFHSEFVAWDSFVILATNSKITYSNKYKQTNELLRLVWW